MVLKTIDADGSTARLMLEGGEVLRVFTGTVPELSLRPGMELDDETLDALRANAGKLSARNRAAAIIAAAPVSERELERRLVRKGESPENARAAVAWLSNLRLLDDRAFARRLMESAAAKGYGRARIVQIFIQKGIRREFWDEVLCDCPDESDALDEFLRKRLRGVRPDARERKRAADALLRRGHTWEDVSSALHRYEQSLCEGVDFYE